MEIEEVSHFNENKKQRNYKAEKQNKIQWKVFNKTKFKIYAPLKNFGKALSLTIYNLRN